MRRDLVGCAVLLAFAAPLAAEDVLLVGGGRISGVIVERTANTLVLEVGPGRVTLPLSRVERVIEGRSALAIFRERAQNLAADDVAGWLALANWAQERALSTAAREAFEHVLRLDPQNAAAHRALGNVLHEGRWMTAEESYRDRGLVPFEGGWVTPAERDSIRRERREAEADRRAESERRALAEADARAREAEARAQAAEANARRVESEARRMDYGFPYSWSFLPVATPVVGCCSPPTVPPPTLCPPSPAPAAPPAPAHGATAGIRQRTTTASGRRTSQER